MILPLMQSIFVDFSIEWVSLVKLFQNQAVSVGDESKSHGFEWAQCPATRSCFPQRIGHDVVHVLPVSLVSEWLSLEHLRLKDSLCSFGGERIHNNKKRLGDMYLNIQSL